MITEPILDVWGVVIQVNNYRLLLGQSAGDDIPANLTEQPTTYDELHHYWIAAAYSGNIRRATPQGNRGCYVTFGLAYSRLAESDLAELAGGHQRWMQ